MPVQIPLRKTERLLSQYLESVCFSKLQGSARNKERRLRKKLLLDHIKAYHRLTRWINETARYRIDGCPDPTCSICQDNKKYLALARTILIQEEKY